MDKIAFRNIQKKLGLTNEGVSEAVDVELFTVQQWASGIWPIPRPVAKLLRILLLLKRSRSNRASEYTTGYDEGYLEGIRGHMKAYDRGYIQGYTEGQEAERKVAGYSTGYGDGYSAAMKAVGL